MDQPGSRRIILEATPDATELRLATALLQTIEQELRDRPGPVHIALTGGTTGIGSLRAFAGLGEAGAIGWDRVHLWWSDERFVPGDSEDRNERQAREAIGGRLAIPAANVHAMPSADDAADARAGAEQYERELARFAEDGTSWPTFSVCLLGVGPDGHIASLFPDREEILVTDRVAVAVHDSPKPPPTRITLTRPVINSSERVWLALTGRTKAAALGLILAGANYASVPAAGAKGRLQTRYFVDESAADEVPWELIDEDLPA